VADDSKESKKFRSGFQLYKKDCLFGFIWVWVEGTIEDAIMTRMITTIALFLLVSCDLGVNSACSTKGGRMCWAIRVIISILHFNISNGFVTISIINIMFLYKQQA
jgi:hypothetical protein